MADRHAQFPMMPRNFNPSILQQQQLAQQNQQQSQVDSQPVQAFNADHNNRLLQQQIQQMQQQQYQYRPQPGVDMAGNQQITDLLRSQSLAQRQQQMGQQQQQQQQQFGLGPSQMGGSSQSQQPQFPDMQPSQPSQQQMPNFPNMGATNGAQLQASFNSRPLHPYASQARQLELMGLAQNQQPQNGPIFTRMAAQQQQQAAVKGQQGLNPPRSDLFSSPSMPSSDGMHGSPHPVSQHSGLMPGNPHPNVPSNGGVPVNPATRRMPPELMDRLRMLRNQIIRGEQEIKQLAAQRSGMNDVVFAQRMQPLMTDQNQRKEMFTKLQGHITQYTSMMNMKPPVAGAPGQPHAQPMQGGHGSPTWPPQAGPSQGQGFPNHGQSQQPNIQPSPSPLHAQLGHIQQQNLAPPRSGQTPHQLIAGPSSNSMSPHMTNQPPFQMPGSSATMQPQPRNDQLNQQPGPSMPMFPPPLDKPRFDTAYTGLCEKRGIVQDPRLMSLDGRSIDLHSLHSEVMLAGGGMKVDQGDQWAIVGAKMGFVQFPGNDVEPAKSGPNVAQHLAHVYKEYLYAFERIYVNSHVNNSKLQQGAGNQPQVSQTFAGGNAGPSAAPQNIQQRNPTLRALNPQQMAAMMKYANVPVAQLRGNMPDKFVEWIEANRAMLQRAVTQQTSFRDDVARPRNAATGQPSHEQAMTSNVPGQFNNGTVVAMPPQPPLNSRPNHHPQHGLPSSQSNVVDGNNVQFPPRSQSTSLNVGGAAMSGRIPRPNQEHMQRALAFVQKAKNDFINQTLPRMGFDNVPDEQRLEYNQAVEQLYRYSQEMESKLVIYYVMIRQEEVIRKLVSIILTAQHQRILLSSANPKYIVNLDLLNSMINQVKGANENFVAIFHNMTGGGVQPPNGHPPNGGPQATPGIPTPSQILQPPRQKPSQPSQLNPPQIANRQVSLSDTPPSKNPHPAVHPGPSSSPAATSISTPPAASTSTPVANAATPATTPSHAVSSPQTPKSPNGKPTTKPKVSIKRNKPLKAVQPPVAAAPEPEPVQPTAGPSALKRPREEEASTEIPTPSVESPPKKIKTEWEGPPSEALVKRQQDVENIKTEEDATAFWKQMTDLLEFADAEGQDSIRSGIASTLDMILKGYGSALDVPDGSDPASMAPLGLGDAGDNGASSPPPHSALADEIGQFFDFSSFTNLDEDDSGSKPTTPDLVSSSSTNPSPESGSEADAAGHAAATASSSTKNSVKTEESVEASDPLRLGLWKEVDGGESAYYQQENWKWDGPMATLEQPWAIFTS